MLQINHDLQLCVRCNLCDLFDHSTTNSAISFNGNINVNKKEQAISFQQVATSENNQIQEKQRTRPVDIFEQMISFSCHKRMITTKEH